MYKNHVDIVAIESCNELIALRSTLEYWEVKTNIFWIGQPKHIVEVLNGENTRSKHIVLGGHGESKGFNMVELERKLSMSQPFTTLMTPKDVENNLVFKGNVVVSSACMTGSQEMADAFLNKGADIYIAPNDYPDGNAALYFLNSFYYYLFCKDLPVKEAFSRAKARDKCMAMFKLFEK